MSPRQRHSSQPLRIGQVTLGERPRVVLAVSRDTAGVRRALSRGVDILELRVDQLQPAGPAELVAQVLSLKRYGVPIIGTVRSAREGGAAELHDAARAALYAAMSPHVDAIDIEVRAARALARTVRLARENGNLIILSSHDFSKTPALGTLTALAAKAASYGADVTKVATHARTRDDVMRLFRFTEACRARHLVTMAMGPLGSVSRLLLPLAGSLLTYTNLTPVHGQIPLERLIADLRFYYPAGAARSR